MDEIKLTTIYKNGLLPLPSELIEYFRQNKGCVVYPDLFEKNVSRFFLVSKIKSQEFETWMCTYLPVDVGKFRKVIRTFTSRAYEVDVLDDALYLELETMSWFSDLGINNEEQPVKVYSGNYRISDVECLYVEIIN
ncbi:MAG: hypothetical protein ACI4F4_04585 [Lachnospiraceae bacterium]